MKKIPIIIVMLLGLSIYRANAQYVRTKPGFSLNISVGAPGPAPYRGAVWVGPEWVWRRGRYVEVPGYWTNPGRHRGWAYGHWKHTRRGYKWTPGYWQ